MHGGPDSRCEHCGGCGHTENKSGCKPKCGYYSRHHLTSDHKFNVVGCTAKQGSPCGYTLEKRPHCKGNCIVFSSRCVKKTIATDAAQQSPKIRPAGRVSMNAAREMATAMRSNTVVLCPRAQGEAGGVGDEEEIADEEKEEEAAGKARDVTMAETDTPTRTTTDSVF